MPLELNFKVDNALQQFMPQVATACHFDWSWAIILFLIQLVKIKCRIESAAEHFINHHDYIMHGAL